MLARISAAAPEADITAAAAPAKAEALARTAEILFGWPEPQWLAKAENLRWLQLTSAGVERHLETFRALPANVVLTSAAGAFGVAIAEHLFAMLLCLTRNLPLHLRNQAEHRWERQPIHREICGLTAGIIGYGDIGREFAARARAFGMRVIAVRRRSESGGNTPDSVWGLTGLARLLAEADVIVNCLPLTPVTRGLLNRERLFGIKQGAYFLNVGRGATVDEEALVECLRHGRLAGAGLDVFAEEPLPESSPLWELPNVIITPHVAGMTECCLPRIVGIFCENLHRYRAGEPLLNQVDLEAGY
ncbi:MAG: D-2-hydroxyacid dehydrogenase [Bacteroidota bacterium]